jgi:hypothetical protein
MCEDFREGRGPGGAKLVIAGDGSYRYKADIVAAERAMSFSPRPDLRGPWHKPNHPPINVTDPKQLGENDFRGLPEHAFIATWPEIPDAYTKYQDALPKAQSINPVAEPVQAILAEAISGLQEGTVGILIGD